MIAFVKDKQDHIKPDPTDLLLAEAEVRDKDPKNARREKSTGEVVFNRTVYTGIGLVANEASTIVFADEFQHGIGKKWFNSISEWMVKTFKFKDVIKNGTQISAKANASNMLLYLSLLSGGTMLLWPMKALEDNKESWVNRINHWFDKRNGNILTAEEVVARDAEVHQALACEPKQTWPSLLLGRTVGVLSVMGLGKLMGHERTQGLQNWSERTFAGSVQADKSRLHRYAALLGLETLTCSTSSLALEIASKFFAKRFVTVRDPETCTQLVHEKDNPPASTGSSAKPTGSDTDCGCKTPVTVEPKAALEQYTRLKRSVITPRESHADAIKSEESSYSLAP